MAASPGRAWAVAACRSGRSARLCSRAKAWGGSPGSGGIAGGLPARMGQVIRYGVGCGGVCVCAPGAIVSRGGRCAVAVATGNSAAPTVK